MAPPNAAVFAAVALLALTLSGCAGNDATGTADDGGALTKVVGEGAAADGSLGPAIVVTPAPKGAPLEMPFTFSGYLMLPNPAFHDSGNCFAAIPGLGSSTGREQTLVQVPPALVLPGWGVTGDVDGLRWSNQGTFMAVCHPTRANVDFTLTFWPQQFIVRSGLAPAQSPVAAALEGDCYVRQLGSHEFVVQPLTVDVQHLDGLFTGWGYQVTPSTVRVDGLQGMPNSGVLGEEVQELLVCSTQQPQDYFLVLAPPGRSFDVGPAPREA